MAKSLLMKSQSKASEKGDQLGMFHFGGSTHVLFRPEVNLEFDLRSNAGTGLGEYSGSIKDRDDSRSNQRSLDRLRFCCISKN